MKRYYTYKPDRHELKARLKKLGKFSLTLGLGVAIGIFISSFHHSSTAPRANKSAEYSFYLKGIFKTLRSEPRVRMVNLKLPSTILSRRTVAQDTRSDFEIVGRTKDIPVVAVSRNAKRFLNKMGVVAIDPSLLPLDTLEGLSLPLSEQALMGFVLIPDVAGSQNAFLVKAR